MSYDAMRAVLMKEFGAHFALWARCAESGGKQYTHRRTFVPEPETDLKISYPGIKTRVKANGGIAYDYRVDYRGVAISHPSIIIDLYNKAAQSLVGIERLKEFLVALAHQGIALDPGAGFSDLLGLSYQPPGRALMEQGNRVYRSLHRGYLTEGNRAWNFTFGQLRPIVSWIALQEDINYPIGRFQGRKMPFYRYLEALYAGNRRDTELLGQVLERALADKRPKLWENMINYDEINRIR